MSASLVGSEMCIRDRSMWQGDHKAIRNALNASQCCNSPQSAIRRAEQAVSYTHLTLPTICSV
eukprot:9168895-Alexandrium_andersonii.AAC.1